MSGIGKDEWEESWKMANMRRNMYMDIVAGEVVLVQVNKCVLMLTYVLNSILYIDISILFLLKLWKVPF
jgi:hypothetical protein